MTHPPISPFIASGPSSPPPHPDDPDVRVPGDEPDEEIDPREPEPEEPEEEPDLDDPEEEEPQERPNPGDPGFEQPEPKEPMPFAA